MRAHSSRLLSSDGENSSDRLQHHPQSVARLRNRPRLPVRRGAGLKLDAEVLQEMPREAFRLHIGEMQPEAHMGTAAERYPGKTMAVALGFLGEAHRIEFFRIVPDLRQAKGEHRSDADVDAGG